MTKYREGDIVNLKCKIISTGYNRLVLGFPVPMAFNSIDVADLKDKDISLVSREYVVGDLVSPKGKDYPCKVIGIHEGTIWAMRLKDETNVEYKFEINKSLVKPYEGD